MSVDFWRFWDGSQSSLESLAAIICLPSLILAIINWALYDADTQTQMLFYVLEVLLMNTFFCRKPVILFLALLNPFLIYVPWGTLIYEPWNLQYDERPDGWGGRIDDLLRIWFFFAYPAFIWILTDALKATNLLLTLAATVIKRRVQRVMEPLSSKIEQELEGSNKNGGRDDPVLNSDQKEEEKPVQDTVKKAPTETSLPDTGSSSIPGLDALRQRKMTPIKGMKEEIENLRAIINGVNARVNTKVEDMSRQLLRLEAKFDEFPRRRNRKAEETEDRIRKLQEDLRDLFHRTEGPMKEIKAKSQVLSKDIRELEIKKNSLSECIEKYGTELREATTERICRERIKMEVIRMRYIKHRRLNKILFHRVLQKLGRLPDEVEAEIQRQGDQIQREEQEQERREKDQEKKLQEREQDQKPPLQELDAGEMSSKANDLMDTPPGGEGQETKITETTSVDLENRMKEPVWTYTDKALEILDREEDESRWQLGSQVVTQEEAHLTKPNLATAKIVQDVDIINLLKDKERPEGLGAITLEEQPQPLEPLPPELAYGLEAKDKPKPSADVGDNLSRPLHGSLINRNQGGPEDTQLCLAAAPEIGGQNLWQGLSFLSPQPSSRFEPSGQAVPEQHNQDDPKADEDDFKKADISMKDAQYGSEGMPEQPPVLPCTIERDTQTHGPDPQPEYGLDYIQMNIMYGNGEIDMSEPPQDSMGSFVANMEAGVHAHPGLPTDVPLRETHLSPPISETDPMSEDSVSQKSHETFEWEADQTRNQNVDLEMSAANDNEDIELEDTPQEIMAGPYSSHLREAIPQQSFIQNIPEEEEPDSFVKRYRNRMSMFRRHDSDSDDYEPKLGDDYSLNIDRENFAYLEGFSDSDDESLIKKSMLQDLEALLEESDPELEDDYDPEAKTRTNIQEDVREQEASRLKTETTPESVVEAADAEAGSEPAATESQRVEGDTHAPSFGDPGETIPEDWRDEIDALDILERDLRAELEKLEQEELLLEQSSVATTPSHSQPLEPQPVPPNFQVFESLNSASFSFGDATEPGKIETEQNVPVTPERQAGRGLVAKKRADELCQGGVVVVEAEDEGGSSCPEKVITVSQELEEPEPEEIAARKKSKLPRRFRPKGMYRSLYDETGRLNEPDEEPDPNQQLLQEEAGRDVKVIDSSRNPTHVPAPESSAEEPDIYSADG